LPRRVNEHQGYETKRQCNRHFTPVNSYGIDKGRRSNDKNAVEDIAAQNCSQANLVISAKLGNNSCRKFGYGRAHCHNSCPDNKFIYAKGNGNASCSGNNEISGSNEKGKTSDARNNDQFPSMLSKNLFRSTSLFSRLDNYP
jgi:hypothetical protein